MPPQVDLEALVSACAGGSCDNKIACETLASAEDLPAALDDPDSDSEFSQQIYPDFPPESFWLSKDAEFDWFDRNAFYERKDSTKRSSYSANLNPSHHPGSNSSSQRFASGRKHKASIIGLPKPQKPVFVDSKNRRHVKAAYNIRPLFPKRFGSIGKSSDPTMIEPSSPKVSCMGRVRSKKDRSRRLRSRQRSKTREPVPTPKPKPAEKKKKKSGFFSSVRSMFRSGKKSRSESERHAPRVDSSTISRDIRERLPSRDLDARSVDSLPRRSVTEGEPLGLGSMTRFTSGRRSDAWADDLA